jgi:hypothetical protein
MLPMLILGVIVALGLVLLLRQAVAVEPRILLRILGWSVGGAILVGVIFLAVTGRLAWAATALAALVPWIVRGLRMAVFGRQMAALLRMFGLSGGGVGGMGGRGGGLGGLGGLGGAHADPDPDDRSTVTTRFLRMTLSHATGAMSGVVREGPLKGRALDDLGEQEAARLWQTVQADPESARVFDAWLERARPEWHAAARASGTEQADPPPSGGPMTRAEALAVLGLEAGASADDIRAAHRRLIVLVHPDRGGTPYLAARLNQARDLLLGTGTR